MTPCRLLPPQRLTLPLRGLSNDAVSFGFSPTAQTLTPPRPLRRPTPPLQSTLPCVPRPLALPRQMPPWRRPQPPPYSAPDASAATQAPRYAAASGSATTNAPLATPAAPPFSAPDASATTQAPRCAATTGSAATMAPLPSPAAPPLPRLALPQLPAVQTPSCVLLELFRCRPVVGPCHAWREIASCTRGTATLPRAPQARATGPRRAESGTVLSTP